MNLKVDLNLDWGELEEADSSVLDYVSSVSVCCGAHAGSLSLSVRSIREARARGAAVGLHPGYPDRSSFGRRQPVESSFAWESICSQVCRLFDLAQPDYLKLHGAAYHDTAQDQKFFDQMVKLLMQTRLPLLGLKGTNHEAAAAAARVPFFTEGFADRRMDSQGKLVPRSAANALVTDPDEAASQAVLLAASVDSICLHSDGANALHQAAAIRARLETKGIRIEAFG